MSDLKIRHSYFKKIPYTSLIKYIKMIVNIFFYCEIHFCEKAIFLGLLSFFLIKKYSPYQSIRNIYYCKNKNQCWYSFALFILNIGD